jgi:O-antigen/teichoic acid export membrane protein
MRLVAGVFAWGFAILGIYLLRPGDTRALLLVVLVGATLVFQAADTIDLWFQSQGQNRRTVLAKLAAYLVSNGVKVALILSTAPVAAFAGAIAFDFFMVAIVLALSYFRAPTNSPWRFSFPIARALFVNSWPFLVGGIAIMTYMRIDQIMIREMRGDRELGIYSAVLPISQLWHLIPMTLSTALAPYVTKMKMVGEADYYRTMKWIFRVFGATALVVALLTMGMASFLIRVLYGPAYLESIPVLQIHVFSNVAVFLGVAQRLWLVNNNRGMLSLYAAIIGAVASIALNYLLIPRFGPVGAAVGCVISFFIAAVFSNLIFAPRIFLLQIGLNTRSA